MIAAIAALLFTAPVAPDVGLLDYLAKKDGSASWKVVRQDRDRTDIDLVSQTWQGAPWKHTVVVLNPPRTGTRNVAMLYVTGGDPNDRDVREMRLVASLTGMPVAILFNIPNQPLWNMREDDLIAHTFEKYLESGDATWPLLFPMTKSAIRAMDAVEDVTKKQDNPLNRFVVTGASKRGWTTWFVGAAADPRVVGLAPMVFDNLNVAEQMPHQIASWGEYSAMIQDYTRRGLQAKLATQDGQRLARKIDPFTYRDRIKVPVLIVNGANDPYWTTDALALYWDELRMPKYALLVPNAGHDLGDKVRAVETIGAFARAVAGEFKLPTINATVGENAVTFRVQGDGLERLSVWQVSSPTLDFRKQSWIQTSSEPVLSAPEARQGLRVRYTPAEGNRAVFGEMRFRINGRAFSLTTPARVFPKR